MKVKVEKKPKSSLQINIVVPSSDVKKTYEEVLKAEVEKAEIPGFRKGQAPSQLVKEKLNTSELYGEVVNKLLQTFYPQALKENKITPISNPKVEIKEFDLEKDFEFTASVAIRPEFKIKEYKKDLRKVFEKKQTEHKDHDHKVNLSPNEVIDVLIQKTDLEVPDLLIDEEIERMLMRLIDQTNTLGMSMEDYLKAQNKTVEQLREEYKKSAENNIKAEFVLQRLVEDEKVEISDKDIEDTINAMGDEKIQEEMSTPLQKWYIKNVLAKNKLLSNLIEEAEGLKEESK